MSVDSSASLLMSIGADTGDAETMSRGSGRCWAKTWMTWRAEFSDWSNKVFGNLSTVQGGLLGVTAAAAAGIVALGGGGDRGRGEVRKAGGGRSTRAW